MSPPVPSRRSFLRLAGAGALSLGLGAAAGRKDDPLRGIFPIVQTPFTPADKLDVDALVDEIRFLDRCGSHGMVWPQLASEYATLSDQERIQGAEAILSASKGLKPAVVIGVQAGDAASAVRFAKHAEKHGADAIISLPPAKTEDLAAITAYYREIGRATSLPLFVQTIGDMTVDFVVRMAKQIPTLRYVKDEAGATLPRISEFRRKAPELYIHTGAHGRNLIDEMARGSSGTMPGASFTDLYVPVWDLWQAGKRKEAMEAYGRALLLVTEMERYGIEGLKYIFHVRGIFPHYATRRPSSTGFNSPGVLSTRTPLDEDGKRVLRELLDYLKPWLRA